MTLFALAALAGVVDGLSQRSAWNRIAAARRDLDDHRTAVTERETALGVRKDDIDGRLRLLRRREQALAEKELGLVARQQELEVRERGLVARERHLDHRERNPEEGFVLHPGTDPGDAS